MVNTYTSVHIENDRKLVCFIYYPIVKIVPVNFNSQHKAMLGHCKMILEHDPTKIAINPKFDKLIIALRTAVDKDGTLDKEATSYNDIFDAFRLALKFYHFEDNSISKQRMKGNRRLVPPAIIFDTFRFNPEEIQNSNVLHTSFVFCQKQSQHINVRLFSLYSNDSTSEANSWTGEMLALQNNIQEHKPTFLLTVQIGII
jgi:hypothetical protein